MMASMETIKRQIKGKRVAEEEMGKGRTDSRYSGDHDKQVTPSQTESRSLRLGDTQSRTSRTRYSRSERRRTKRSCTEGSRYQPSYTHQMTSGHTDLPWSADLGTVLEERAQRREDHQACAPKGSLLYSD
ncbi:hypothetical protein HYC85_028080 [Camellia sinensis]|uniref:Uncharacterized protein n=1 Tax=Camellia sinensis TaxID=4442 RepID=A0A7J7FUE3_CAMSI|nr:hypothetical protein HYC85_028080 [Camellia sinensis]